MKAYKRLIDSVHISVHNLYDMDFEDKKKNVEVVIYRTKKNGTRVRREYKVRRKNELVMNALSEALNSNKYERNYVTLYCYPSFFIRVRTEDEIKEQYRKAGKK